MKWTDWDSSLAHLFGLLEGNKLQAESKLYPGRWRKNKDHAGTRGQWVMPWGGGWGRVAAEESRPLWPLLAFTQVCSDPLGLLCSRPSLRGP